MKYLHFSIFVLALSACSSYYKNIQSVKTASGCAEQSRPQRIATSWFDTSIDVVGKHLSGIMLIKEMPDGSSRIVFTNESGLTIFDFEFDTTGKFAVRKIISQLDKKPVIQTLRKDFSLLLGIPFQGELQQWEMNQETYLGVVEGKEKIYYVVTPACIPMKRFEIGSRRKRKVSITFEGTDARLPQRIVISHFTFDMTIALKKIENNATE